MINARRDNKSYDYRYTDHTAKLGQKMVMDEINKIF